MRTSLSFSLIIVLVNLLFIFNVFAESMPEAASGTGSPAVSTGAGAGDSENGDTTFAGIKFGVGLALTLKIGKDRIESARVVDGLVRIEDEKNRLPKVMLESHYFFLPSDFSNSKNGSNGSNDQDKQDNSNFISKNIGFGPFMAVAPDSSGGQVIGAYALGLMVGLKRKPEDSKNGSSWNLGVGYVVNTKVKTLGDGIEEGKPLPGGETEIRYKYTNQPGWLLISSFSW